MIRTRVRTSLLISAVILSITIAIPAFVFAQQATPVPEDTEMDEAALIERGEEIYNNVCIACHRPEGMGVEGVFPALAGNPLVTLEDPTVITLTVLFGRGGMPRFNATYSDEEIAGVVSYIRDAWENDAPPVSAEFVEQVREDFEAQDAATPVSEIAGQDPDLQAPATPPVE